MSTSALTTPPKPGLPTPPSLRAAVDEERQAKDRAQAIDRAVARVTRDMDRVDFSSDRRGALERREKVALGAATAVAAARRSRRRRRPRRSRPAPRRRRSAATKSGARARRGDAHEVSACSCKSCGRSRGDIGGRRARQVGAAGLCRIRRDGRPELVGAGAPRLVEPCVESTSASGADNSQLGRAVKPASPRRRQAWRRGVEDDDATIGSTRTPRFPRRSAGDSLRADPEYYDEARWAPLVYNTRPWRCRHAAVVCGSVGGRADSHTCLIGVPRGVHPRGVCCGGGGAGLERRCDKAQALGRGAATSDVGYTWRSVVELSQDEAKADTALWVGFARSILPAPFAAAFMTYSGSFASCPSGLRRGRGAGRCRGGGYGIAATGPSPRRRTGGRTPYSKQARKACARVPSPRPRHWLVRPVRWSWKWRPNSRVRLRVGRSGAGPRRRGPGADARRRGGGGGRGRPARRPGRRRRRRPGCPSRSHGGTSRRR